MLNSMTAPISLQQCILSRYLQVGGLTRQHRYLTTAKVFPNPKTATKSEIASASLQRKPKLLNASTHSYHTSKVFRSSPILEKSKTTKSAAPLRRKWQPSTSTLPSEDPAKVSEIPSPQNRARKSRPNTDTPQLYGEKLPQKNSIAPTKVSSSSLSYHWNTIPPTSDQLAHASEFFELNPPEFLWSTEKFKLMDFGSSPEVCFLGRSNVGKSSLLNALVHKKIAHTSAKPGRTKTMNAFAVGGPESEGKPRLVVLDMPGYGKGGAAEWGTQVLKYLSKRRQLKRAFLLVNSEHGLKETDRQMLKLFEDIKVPYQVILSKVDKVISLKSTNKDLAAMGRQFQDLTRTVEDVKNALEPDSTVEDEDDWHAVGEIIACSSEIKVDGKRPGIDAVRFAMLQAAGMELQQEVVREKPVEIVPHEELFG